MERNFSSLWRSCLLGPLALADVADGAQHVFFAFDFQIDAADTRPNTFFPDLLANQHSHVFDRSLCVHGIDDLMRHSSGSLYTFIFQSRSAENLVFLVTQDLREALVHRHDLAVIQARQDDGIGADVEQSFEFLFRGDQLAFRLPAAQRDRNDMAYRFQQFQGYRRSPLGDGHDHGPDQFALDHQRHADKFLDLEHALDARRSFRFGNGSERYVVNGAAIPDHFGNDLFVRRFADVILDVADLPAQDAGCARSIFARRIGADEFELAGVLVVAVDPDIDRPGDGHHFLWKCIH